jgi:hypothetical protein
VLYNYWEYSVWVALSPAGSGSPESSFAFYGIFIAEGIDEVGDKGSVGTPVDDKWHS